MRVRHLHGPLRGEAPLLLQTHNAAQGYYLIAIVLHVVLVVVEAVVHLVLILLVIVVLE
jgi:hypothetical protein